MPRKQRFKPSRKPKPISQTESVPPKQGDGWIGQPTDHETHHHGAHPHDSPQVRDEPSSRKPDVDQHSH